MQYHVLSDEEKANQVENRLRQVESEAFSLELADLDPSSDAEAIKERQAGLQRQANDLKKKLDGLRKASEEKPAQAQA